MKRSHEDNEIWSPDASREILDELARPAADTPERRRTFERVMALEATFRRQGFTFKPLVPKTK